jgi:predicted outer membrane repeat protein
VSFSKFANNRASTAGAGVYVRRSAQLNLTDSLVVGNIGLGAAGVAVVDKATAHLDNVVVKDNSARVRGAGMSVGDLASADVHNCTFHNNTSSQGGGIYAFGQSSTKVTHTVFTNNSANGTALVVAAGGGAIAVDDNATMTIVDVNMSTNTAVFGGAIDVSNNGTLRLHSSTISDSTAALSGGAMFLTGSCNAVVTLSTLTNNTAKERDGGAVFLDETTNATITASRLIDNRARLGGGVLCLNCSVCLVASNMSGNRATIRGGALAAEENATVIFEDCGLDANQAPRGGAIGLLNASQVGLYRCLLQGNAASGYGGGVFAADTAGVTMLSCRLFQNSASEEGGGLLVMDSSTVIFGGEAQGMGNTASKGGFARLDGSAQLEVTDGIFEGNYVSANGRGGLLYGRKNTLAKLTACRVTGNMYQPDVEGGAFFIDGNATLNMASCKVDGMHAQRGGAFAIFDNGSIHAHNCIVSNCTAIDEGGGLFTSSVNHQSWLGGYHRDMHATTGAAMCIMGGGVHISATTFGVGTASDGGGALSVGMGARVALDQCEIRECTAVNASGGALLLQGDSQVSLVRCNISDCRAQLYAGGAIAGLGNVNVVLQHCRVHHNRGAKCGGAAYVQDQARLVASSSTIFDNFCSDRGGGVCAVDDSSFPPFHSARLYHLSELG